MGAQATSGGQECPRSGKDRMRLGEAPLPSKLSLTQRWTYKKGWPSFLLWG